MKASSQQPAKMARCVSTCGWTKPMTSTHSHLSHVVRRRRSCMNIAWTPQFSRMTLPISSWISHFWSSIEEKWSSAEDIGMERFVCLTHKRSNRTSKGTTARIDNSHSSSMPRLRRISLAAQLLHQLLRILTRSFPRTSKTHHQLASKTIFAPLLLDQSKETL